MITFRDKPLSEFSKEQIIELFEQYASAMRQITNALQTIDVKTSDDDFEMPF